MWFFIKLSRNVSRIMFGSVLKVIEFVPNSLHQHHVLMTHIDKICVGDWLPEDEGLIVHLPYCFMGCVVERLEQFVSSVSRKKNAEVLLQMV